MTPHFADESVTLYHGDCLDVLRELPDNSVDAVVTDPPYGLADHAPAVVAKALGAWLSGDREHVPDGRGFMGRDWDKFVPPPGVFDECMRVLKPGGHLLSFAGSRTVDLMTTSIRFAGFEIRDSIAWLYGSGFPKSLDVSKAIDKRRDDDADIRRVTGWLAEQRDRAGLTNRHIDEAFGFSGMAGHWTAAPHLKIAQVPQWGQWLKLRDLIGFGDEMDAEVWRLNGRKGEPGEAWDQREVVGKAYRVRRESTVQIVGLSDGEYDVTAPATDAAQQWQGWGTALKPSHEPVVVARKPLSGTVAANVQEHGTGALNIDACRTGNGMDRTSGGATGKRVSADEGYMGSWSDAADGRERPTGGRWPTNVVLDESQANELDKQTGYQRDGVAVNRNKDPEAPKPASVYGAYRNGVQDDRTYGSGGGASRFFPVFRYEAKAPTSERPRDGETAHPTVKPLDLMRWLVRLVTPPGGTVLEPFAGSGTTAEACVIEGFQCIAIEREADYLPLIVARLAKPIQMGFSFEDGGAA